MTGPIVRLAFSLAARNRRQAATIAEQQERIDRLAARVQRLRVDVDLLAACLPREKRRDALALVRDRHRIENGQIIEEATG